MRASVLASFLGLVLALTPACGGGDDDGGGGGGSVDGGGGGSVDGGGGGSADANNGVDKAIGQSCTPPVGTLGQGDCPADYICLPSINGSKPFCSKSCTMQGMTDPVCTAAYAGPGAAGCFLAITVGTDPAQGFCNVLCAAPENVCPAATCDGTCPGALTCTPNPADNTQSFCQ